ncbi:hypothetical protein O988_03899, partial [Pseudogymnoascus sp. VKM F-3808]
YNALGWMQSLWASRSANEQHLSFIEQQMRLYKASSCFNNVNDVLRQDVEVVDGPKRSSPALTSRPTALPAPALKNGKLKKAERLKDKDEDEETAVELGGSNNTSGRGSMAGLKEDEDTEKGELTGEQLGLNEPRRRN